MKLKAVKHSPRRGLATGLLVLMSVAAVLPSAAAMADTLELEDRRLIHGGAHRDQLEGKSQGASGNTSLGATLGTLVNDPAAPAWRALPGFGAHEFDASAARLEQWQKELEQWQKENRLRERLARVLVGSSRKTRARALEELREHYRLTRSSLSYARLWGVKDTVHP